MDYTNLNKSCPKDAYLLPCLDQLVDSTTSNEPLTFMDAYSGYNQIRMHLLDEKHTTFYTNNGVCCYKLAKPRVEETLYIYLGVSEIVVNSVLVREEGNLQQLVYYVSKVMLQVEKNYSAIEKWGFALIMAFKKLRLYFMAHTIIVWTDQPLKQVFKCHDASGRMIKWAVELGQFDLDCALRTSIKAQALADFISEATQRVLGAGCVLIPPKRGALEECVTNACEKELPPLVYNMKVEGRYKIRKDRKEMGCEATRDEAHGANGLGPIHFFLTFEWAVGLNRLSPIHFVLAYGWPIGHNGLSSSTVLTRGVTHGA
ncbi:hypothetical protein CRG98_006737 [Punica granatum]|uniref:Reverse transcriptase RNase H-like domain-containing protein n=1 Tax=Punica granatum TaxID=22663 RepID=A0A2I0KWN7_PUNGR|nr:hypothetical protein CRG98_006737 [Punica granatum]